METVYEVVFKGNQRSIFRDEEGNAFEIEDPVVVETEDRQEIGRVIWKGVREPAGDVESAKVRKATEMDMEAFRVRREKELAALEVFADKIAEHSLPMKPIDVEYEDNKGRITFYFTADHRVDFRALVRDLAHIYRTRIELRQISPRQEVQRQGGYGTCGRALCCSSS